MGDDIKFGNAQLLQQCHLNFGLAENRISRTWFGRQPEAEHVAGDDAPTFGKRAPNLMPVPGRCWKAVDQQQWPALTSGPVGNAV